MTEQEKQERYKAYKENEEWTKKVFIKMILEQEASYKEKEKQQWLKEYLEEKANKVRDKQIDAYFSEWYC